jgi:hypothetical protein
LNRWRIICQQLSSWRAVYCGDRSIAQVRNVIALLMSSNSEFVRLMQANLQEAGL